MNVSPNKRPVVRCLRCSYEEDKLIREAAYQASLSISDYLRSVVLDEPTAAPIHPSDGRIA